MDRIKSDLVEILPKLVDKLTGDHIFLASGVSLSLANDDDVVNMAVGQRFLVVKPGRFPLVEGLTSGAGREEMAHEGDISVNLFCRLNTDRQGEDARWLLDETLGALRCWFEVLQSLHMYDPTAVVDEVEYWILNKPFRCLWWAAEPRAVGRKAPGWGKIASAWELAYTQKLDYPTRIPDGPEFT